MPPENKALPENIPAAPAPPEEREPAVGESPIAGMSLEELISGDPDIKYHLLTDPNDAKARFVTWSRLVMTGFEKKVWQTLGAQHNPWGFFPQVEILGFVVDFYSPKHKVALEADGPDHDRSMLQDRQRDKILLKNKGIKTFRMVPGDLVVHSKQTIYKFLEMFVAPDFVLTPAMIDGDEGGIK